ncbi:MULTISPECIES: anti-sigma factor domain-containing protein [Mycobacterium]|uniref:Anti-sigma-K factor RskA n=1 Tax=Mycobacterium gordonae TaxID=1778 RepID=A0A1X1W0S2_MYCGO|nr:MULTISPECIES: anti-sigma factor [Mycobacterium]MBI2702567.1 anti-sigma factor [Mycobacterium sp.]MCQ4362637.1 anti-sigma factor [Mycobacterium gordonae]MCV7004978.1 anti-sigma factor [Mycobacterium gordonae]ODR22958.1 anti-sigma factor [Mycobacterium gordonae]ORV79440.1 anti-sigma factor [Mycobacterium gordonae]
MNEPTDFDLLELATPYALHAVSDAERVEIDRRVAAAPAPIAAAFNEEVRSVREAMALVSSASAAEPPDQLRAAVLTAIQPDRRRHSPWRARVLAAAAAVVIGLGGFGLGMLARPHPTSTVTEQVLTAPDMKSVSRPLGPGQATVMFSRDRNAAVLVMNNVPPPSNGTVYQMWLIGANGPRSAGTMGSTAVQPTTTATMNEIGNCRALAFTVEPGAGSPQPTGTILAEIPLK